VKPDGGRRCVAATKRGAGAGHMGVGSVSVWTLAVGGGV